jgi:hypothetical protein
LSTYILPQKLLNHWIRIQNQSPWLSAGSA